MLIHLLNKEPYEVRLRCWTKFGIEKEVSTQTTEFPRTGMATQAAGYTQWDSMPSQITDKITAADGATPAPDEIKTAVIETIRDSAAFNQFVKFVKMQENNVTEFKVDLISFKFGDGKWGRPLPKKAWEACRFLMVGYWELGQPNLLQRL